MTVIKPSENCELCKEHPGYMHFEGRTLTECLCILVQRAKLYLGPEYANAQFFKELDVNSFTKKVYFYEKDSDRFKSFVKSYLLNNAMTLNFKSVHAYDVIQSNVSSKNATLDYRKDLIEPDFLIINFYANTPNKLSYQIISGVIMARSSSGKMTWCFSHVGFKHPLFIKSYSEDLADFILFGCDSSSLPLPGLPVNSGCVSVPPPVNTEEVSKQDSGGIETEEVKPKHSKFEKDDEEDPGIRAGKKRVNKYKGKNKDI